MKAGLLRYSILQLLVPFNRESLVYPPAANGIWQVAPPLDFNDALYAGWSQIAVVKEIEVSNGVQLCRTYAHHPHIFYLHDTVYLTFSSAPADEDSMGQDVRISVSKDRGLTWTHSNSLIPPAMLPSQTDPRNFTYWCDRSIVQRAWQPIGFVHLPEENELYAVGLSASEACPGGYQSAGKVAQRINKNGSAIGDPCWLLKNEYTTTQLYNETIFGTKFSMRDCEKKSVINSKLEEPDAVPAWGSWLYNHELYAADGRYNMQEQTFATWFDDDDSPTGGYWQRFWRDISATNNSLAVWLEYNESPNGDNWYPRVLEQYGNAIYKTNIPDGKTKQFFGRWEPDGARYLVSNPRHNDDLERQPLTIATSRGKDQVYKKAGVLRTNASRTIAPETRNGYKNLGFQYPSTVQIGRAHV